MTSYTTTCPFCQAKFLINQDQLNLKAGKARCGKCAKVFQANENLSQTNTNQNITTEKTEVAEKPHIISSSDSNSLFNPTTPIKDNTESDFNALLDTSIGSESEEQETLFNDDMELDESFLGSSTNHKVVSNNDLDTSNIFGDDIAHEFRNTMTDMQAVNPFDVSIADQSALSEANNNNVSDEKWVESLLSEESDTSISDKSKQEQSEDLMDFLEDIGAHTTQISTISPNQITESKDASLPSISATKVPIAKVPKKKKGLAIGRVIGSFIWSVLTLGAILTLGAQYLYFNYDTLARDQKGREHLALACSYVGCELPNVNADAILFKDIKTLKNDSKTTLSFIVYNQSLETTLIPAIKVTLFKNNKEVGANVILPNQYLNGSYKKLPANQPLDGKVSLGIGTSSFDQISLDAIY